MEEPLYLVRACTSDFKHVSGPLFRFPDLQTAKEVAAALQEREQCKQIEYYVSRTTVDFYNRMRHLVEHLRPENLSDWKCKLVWASLKDDLLSKNG